MRTLAIGALCLCSSMLGGCSTTTTAPSNADGGRAARRDIDTSVDLALAKLYDNVHDARDLASRAHAVLVFPSVVQAGFVVGGEYGRGALKIGTATQDYYSIAAGSVGWQIGAQSKAVILMFMSQDAYQRFRNSTGWEVGADATVALAHVGANGQIDTSLINKPVIGFVMTNTGLMAGVSLQGAKISHIAP